MANMSDRNRVAAIVQGFFTSSTTFTVTPGTSGGSAYAMSPPLHLRLMTTQGSNTSNGSELSGTGYTTGGATMGSSAFGAPSSGVATNNNAVSWSVGSSWTTVTSIEIWDTAGTPLRWLQGALTSSISGAANGDTVQFASASISIDMSAW